MNNNPIFLSVELFNDTERVADFPANKENLWILCRKNGTSIDDVADLWGPKLPTKKYYHLVKLILAPPQMVFPTLYRQNMIQVNTDTLGQIIEPETKLPETILIWVMIDTDERMLTKMLTGMYRTTMNDVLECAKTAQIHNLLDADKIKILSEIMGAMAIGCSWTEKHNCHLVIDREPKWQTSTTTIDEYPDGVTEYNGAPKYDSAQKKTENKKFMIPTKEEIIVLETIFNQILETDTVPDELVTRFLYEICLHQKYGFLALKSGVLPQNSMTAYYMRYAWLTICNWETANYNNFRDADSYIFTLEQANKLPLFGVDEYALNYSPYIPPTFGKVNNNKIIYGAKLNASKGLVDIATFRKKLNIFMTGDENSPIFEGIDWSNMAITGSCMAAILPNSRTDNFIEYVEANYAESDMDMICNHVKVKDYLAYVIELNKILKRNLNDTSSTTIQSGKKITIRINEAYMMKLCQEKGVEYATIVKDLDNPAIKILFHDLYITGQMHMNIHNIKKIGGNMLETVYATILEISGIQNIRINVEKYVHPPRQADDDIMVKYSLMEKLDGVDTCLYKINSKISYTFKSSKLKRPIDIFYIFGEKISSSISRFHLPCVRSYYNGTTCHMFPSAISAYMTLVNISVSNYSYQCKGMVNVLQKYRKRGYGTILSTKNNNTYLKESGEQPGFTSTINDTFSNDNIKNIRLIELVNINANTIEPAERWILDACE
jgi:hypothetical protein